jgi:hypothetical protein
MGNTKIIKRKTDEEKRTSNSESEEAHYAEHGSKPQCLICLQVIGVSKENNVNKHYNTLYNEKMTSVQEQPDL